MPRPDFFKIILAGGDCGDNDCPTVALTQDGNVAVQGAALDIPIPDGEAAVVIPADLIREAARALGR